MSTDGDQWAVQAIHHLREIDTGDLTSTVTYAFGPYVSRAEAAQAQTRVAEMIRAIPYATDLDHRHVTTVVLPMTDLDQEGSR